MQATANAFATRLSGYGGPLPASQLDLPASLDKLLSSESCRLVAVVLPQDSRFSGFRLQASDSKNDGDCPGDRPCPIGNAQWLFEPGVTEGTGAKIVYSVFRNSSDIYDRSATLTVYFVPPRNWPAVDQQTD